MPQRVAASSSDKHCVHPTMRAGTISLPVIKSNGGEHGHHSRIRPSRSGKRRAIVLASVQGLMIAHVVMWLLSRRYGWFGGQTTTPIEPSESMDFAKSGIINAGLIFFAIALLSTLILGRWFCGWGCHVVLLQDLCGWMMKKCGVRPKPFRSRFLIYVPLLLALYMFIWPMAYRWGVLPAQSWLATKTTMISPPQPVSPWRVQSHLTTPDFWRTFAGAAVAIPFLFVCGFATVYFLGAKGFCTYGCPYGGFFAPLDKYAPGRIRVTDACEGCGHCTAVCTSNVRVHEEVREYGMVVDPGCMKCLDCVSVCPNDALYFGFGAPAIRKGEAKNQTPTRKHDLSMGEEFLCAAVFALTFVSVRGVYGLVPMLMAAGIAGCATFIVWKAWRLLRDPNVTLHRWQLKLRGRWRGIGVAYLAAAMLVMGLVAHSGMIKAITAQADRHFAKMQVDTSDVSAGRLASVDDADREHAKASLRWFGRASSISAGGWGLSTVPQDRIDAARAILLCVLNEFDDAEAMLRAAHARHENEATTVALARFLSDRDDAAKQAEAIELYERTLTEHPEFDTLLADYEPWALSLGRIDQVLAIHRDRLAKRPFDHTSLRSIAITLLQAQRLDEGLAAARRWADAQPKNPEAHHWNAIGYAMAGREEPAIASARLAVQYSSGGQSPSRELLAQLLEATGLIEEAAAIRAGTR